MTDPYVEDEINLRDYWRVLVRRRALILGITFGMALVVTIYTLLQPNIYQSKVTLMPLGKTASGLQNLLGESLGFLSLGLSGGENAGNRILAILQSRTLAEDTIRRLGLLQRLFVEEWDAERQQWRTDDPPTLQDTVQRLSKLVSIDTDTKTGVITITVEHTDSELAAAIANQYTDTLQNLLNENAFSLAKKNRLFIEGQLRKIRRDLTTAEEALRSFEQQHGIVALDAQAKAAVDTIATLESQIMAREVQLAVLQRSITGASQEVTLLQEELRGLRGQLARLRYGQQTYGVGEQDTNQNDLSALSLKQAPEIKLQFLRLQREALIQDKLFTLLMQQLEQAKIDEAKDETAFQVLDRAIPSERRSKPKRRLNVMLGTVLGGFLSVFVVFFLEYKHARVYTREQIEYQGETILLATIPSSASPPLRFLRRQPVNVAPSALVLHQPPGAPLIEAYRYLYTRFQHLNGLHGPRTVVFTAPESEKVLPAVAVNLAVVAAGTGDKTLLVDGNLLHPVLHELMQCPLIPGLAEVLHDPAEWHKGIHATAIDNLHLLPVGTVSQTTSFLLEAPAFDAVLAHLKDVYDRILFVAPPVLGCTDAAVLGSKVEATCLVLTVGVSRLHAFTEARAALQAVKTNLVGAVLTNFNG